MKILYIGSLALNEHVSRMQPTWALRQPMDVDIIATYEDAMAFLKAEGCRFVEPLHEGRKLHGIAHTGPLGRPKHYEVELAWEASLPHALMTAVWDQSVPDPFSDERRYATIDALYMLKMSHRYRKNSVHFRKTMDDIHALRNLGAKIPEEFMPWFKAREKETYTYSHPKLNTTRANFFADDGVNYKYDHDTIHQAIKVMEKPAFDYFKPDTAEVFCSKELFNACDYSVRRNAVYEESCVLALERSIVPHPGVLTPDQAFAKALEKVCTSITSGWFREFAWENYYQALEFYDEQTTQGRNYIDLFKAGLDNGTVKLFNKA